MAIVWFDPRQARRARRRERPTPRRVAEKWAREDAELLNAIGSLVEALAGTGPTVGRGGPTGPRSRSRSKGGR